MDNKLSAIDIHKQREDPFSPVESHWVYQLHFRAGPMPRSNGPTQNKLHGRFVNLLFHFFFLSYWSLFFMFVFLWVTLVLFLLFFLKERVKSWVGREERRIWEELWEGKYLIKIYEKNFSKNVFSKTHYMLHSIKKNKTKNLSKNVGYFMFIFKTLKIFAWDPWPLSCCIFSFGVVTPTLPASGKLCEADHYFAFYRPPAGKEFRMNASPTSESRGLILELWGLGMTGWGRYTAYYKKRRNWIWSRRWMAWSWTVPIQIQILCQHRGGCKHKLVITGYILCPCLFSRSVITLKPLLLLYF